MYKNNKAIPPSRFSVLPVDRSLDSDSDADEDQQDAAYPQDAQLERIPSSDFMPVKKPKEGKVRKKAPQIGRLSQFQVYVKRAPGRAYGQAYNLRELTDIFSRFGELNEQTECPDSLPGLAFIKFRTRAAARAAVEASPITAGDLHVDVQYLDLERQSANVEWNREQERLLMLNEAEAIAAGAAERRQRLRVPATNGTSPSRPARSLPVAPVYAQPVLLAANEVPLIAHPVPATALTDDEALQMAIVASQAGAHPLPSAAPQSRPLSPSASEQSAADTLPAVVASTIGEIVARLQQLAPLLEESKHRAVEHERYGDADVLKKVQTELLALVSATQDNKAEELTERLGQLEAEKMAAVKDEDFGQAQLLKQRIAECKRELELIT